jgi:hypothetical protein
MNVVFHATAKPVRGGLPPDITLSLFLEFVPVLGMQMMLPGFGAYLQVNDVFWDVNDPGVFKVFFDEFEINDIDIPTLNQAVKAGWKED